MHSRSSIVLILLFWLTIVALVALSVSAKFSLYLCGMRGPMYDLVMDGCGFYSSYLLPVLLLGDVAGSLFAVFRQSRKTAALVVVFSWIGVFVSVLVMDHWTVSMGKAEMRTEQIMRERR